MPVLKPSDEVVLLRFCIEQLRSGTIRKMNKFGKEMAKGDESKYLKETPST